MFFVFDTQEHRHAKIRSLLKEEPKIAFLLAAVDFEWTVRRTIIAMGQSLNKHIREDVLRTCHGAKDYKKAWKKQVLPRFKKSLPEG